MSVFIKKSCCQEKGGSFFLSFKSLFKMGSEERWNPHNSAVSTVSTDKRPILDIVYTLFHPDLLGVNIVTGTFALRPIY